MLPPSESKTQTQRVKQAMKADFSWHLLAPLGLILVTAAALSTALIIALRPWLQRYAMVRPNTRSSHYVPTPQGGGIAVIAAALSVTALASAALYPAVSELCALCVVLIAATALAAVGAFDDIRTIEIKPRLFLQAGLFAGALAALPPDLRVIDVLPWWVERAALLLAGVWFINLVNFMDGIDWMTVAETVPMAGGLILLGLAGALPVYGVILLAALVGAIIGFAPFNRPVASLFLGDVGSLPIGLLLGWILIMLAGRGHLPAALLLPLYYLADTTTTLAWRAIRRERIWEAHRSHFYQRAIASGFSVRQVVARVFILNWLLVALAVATAWCPSLAMKVAAVAVGAVLVGGLLVVFAKGRA